MGKIKPKDGYVFTRQTNTGTGHIHQYTGGLGSVGMLDKKLCGNAGYIEGVSEEPADKGGFCKSCLKHADAWEPVKEHRVTSETPSLPEIGDPHPANSAKGKGVHILDELPTKQVIEVDGMMWCAADIRRMQGKASPTERETKLQGTISQLENELQTAKDSHRALAVYANETLIGDYAPDQLKTILAAAPPAESFEGFTLEFRTVKPGDEWWNHVDGVWELWSGQAFQHFIRTPIIEYIEGDDITDELVQKHGGRINAQGRDNKDGGEWADIELYRVFSQLNNRFMGTVRTESPYSGFWPYCRINKADIPEGS